MLLLRRQMSYIVLPLVNIFKLVGLVKPEIDRTMFTRSAVFRKEHQIVDWNIKRVIHKMVKNGIYNTTIDFSQTLTWSRFRFVSSTHRLRINWKQDKTVHNYLCSSHAGPKRENKPTQQESRKNAQKIQICNFTKRFEKLLSLLSKGKQSMSILIVQC